MYIFSLQVKIHFQISLVKLMTVFSNDDGASEFIMSPSRGESEALAEPLDIFKAQSSGVHSLLICSITAAGHQSVGYSSIISFKCQKKSLFEGRK